MRIQAIEIERQDTETCCGVMDLEVSGHRRQALWTVTWLPWSEVEVEIFPEDVHGLADAIQNARVQLIDTLLDTVLTRSGREPLPT